MKIEYAALVIHTKQLTDVAELAHRELLTTQNMKLPYTRVQLSTSPFRRTRPRTRSTTCSQARCPTWSSLGSWTTRTLLVATSGTRFASSSLA